MFNLIKEYQHNGMIDWLSLRVDASLLPQQFLSILKEQTGRIIKVSSDGEIEWEAGAWNSIRSDTHQISCCLSSFFQLQGSPARVGLSNNVFGSLDIHYCAEKMITFIANQFGFERSDLPSLSDWVCTRIDVTRNYFMQNEAEVKQAILAMKQMPSSRQKVSYEENGVYIGKRSKHQTGKIYAKGQDAKRLNRTNKANYTEEELKLAQHLLRFELSLKSRTINQISKSTHWSSLTPNFLLNRLDQFFNPYISNIEITDMGTLLDTLLDIAPTEGQAKSAYNFYHLIRQLGYEQAKASVTQPTFYRHRGLLMKAGLSLADLTKSNVVPLRTKPIVLGEAVCSWRDIQKRINDLRLSA